MGKRKRLNERQMEMSKSENSSWLDVKISMLKQWKAFTNFSQHTHSTSAVLHDFISWLQLMCCAAEHSNEDVDCSTAGSEKLWKKKTLIPLDVCERKTKMQAGKEIVFHWHERIDFNFFSNNFCEREVEEFFCKLNLLFILLNSSLSQVCSPSSLLSAFRQARRHSWELTC